MTQKSQIHEPHSRGYYKSPYMYTYNTVHSAKFIHIQPVHTFLDDDIKNGRSKEKFSIKYVYKK